MEKKTLQTQLYAVIDPVIRKRNVYNYMNRKLNERIERLTDFYEAELLQKDIEKMRLAVELKFVLTSYNRLVTVPIHAYPVWLRCLIWWENSRWKKWWDSIKKKYLESKRR